MFNFVKGDCNEDVRSEIEFQTLKDEIFQHSDTWFLDFGVISLPLVLPCWPSAWTE